MITQESIQALLRYDGRAGHFYWREASGRHGRIPAGTVAGTLNAKGYIAIRIGGKDYRAHRLAWLYVHGTMPDQLDHINRVKTDNRLSNLREASREQNCGNIGLRRDNSTGYRGVTYNAAKQKYQARLHRKSLGYFDTAELAALAAHSYRVTKYGEFAV